MVDPKILEYIKANLDSKGTNTEQIKSSLRQSGWPDDQINAGFMQVQGTQPAPGPQAQPATTAPGLPKKKGRKKLMIALVVLFILIILFLYVSATIVTDFREMFPGGGDIIPIDIPFIS
jgi:hypothetical protein